MAIFLIIYVISMFMSINYYISNAKDITIIRVIITMTPIINTIFILKKISLKQFINEFKKEFK